MSAIPPIRMKSLCGAAFLLALGFGLGRFTSGDASPTAMADDPAVVKSGTESELPGSGVPMRRGSGKSKTGDDSTAELRKAMDAPDLVDGTWRFSAALQGLTAVDAASAAKALWARPGRSVEIDERKRLLGYRWGQIGGAEAVKFALAQSGQGKIAVITSAVAGWASVDPAAAKAWIERQSEPGLAGVLASGLVEGWARQDLAGVTGFVLGLPAGQSSEQMMRTVASGQLRQNAGGALSWALELPDSPLKTAAIDEVAARWAWADPAAALAKVTQIPDPAQMQSTTATAMAIWARTDPEAASTYLTKMGDGTAKDQAVAAFSQTGAAENPAASAIWAATISDATLREASLVAVGTAWLRRDAVAALAWLPGSGLSTGTQAQISSQIRR